MSQRDEPELGDVFAEPPTIKATAQTVVLSLRKETKHTFVYGTDEDDAFASSVYIAKSALPKPAPRQVRLTMEVVL